MSEKRSIAKSPADRLRCSAREVRELAVAEIEDQPEASASYMIAAAIYDAGAAIVEAMGLPGRSRSR